jgi:hypothetical protein
MLEGIPAADIIVFPLTHTQAERQFFNRWDQLVGEKL